MAFINQLALNFNIPDDISLDNYYCGANIEVLHYLHALAGESSGQLIYLWGCVPGIGRTHLAIACCKRFREFGFPSVYIDLEMQVENSPEILDDLEKIKWVSIDNLEAIVGNKKWEEGMFHFFNRVLGVGGNLLVTANASPFAIPLALPDLKSRFCSCLIYQLQALSDEDKLSALILRARNRGLNLPIETARYIFNHCERDMHNLFANLDKLAKASLSMKRALTIPFVKEFFFR